MEWHINNILKLIIAVIVFANCDFKLDNNVNNEMKNNIIMDRYEEILKENHFNFPTKELFNSKLKQVFGLNIYEHENQNEFQISPKKTFSDESTFYPKAIVNKKYIYWNQDEGWVDLSFVNLNKYIFYQDKEAFNFLKKNDANGYLDYLVQYYGFVDDPNLQTYVFNKIDGDLHDSYAYLIFFGRTGIDGNFELRKGLLSKYLSYKPDTQIPISIFIEKIIDNQKDDYIKEYEGDRDRDAAFVLNEILNQMQKQGEFLISGWVDSILTKYPKYLEKLKANNAFGYTLLDDYIENTYEPSK